MRYVLIGLGNIGQKRRKLLGDACVAVVDPLQPEATVRDLSELDPASYDAAILSTPNDVKQNLLALLLAQSKPVLVDKPLKLSRRQSFEELRACADRGGVLWHTSYNHRFEPLIMRFKAELESGVIGSFYQARLFYGNGTVLNCKGTWRDSGLGVVEDLGCHLLDLAAYLLGSQDCGYRLAAARAYEMKAYDYGLMLSDDGSIECEVSYLSWRNRFTIDAYGSEGSMHLSGLRKWGLARLEVHRRVRPSGAPMVQTFEDQGADISWSGDQRAFEESVSTGIWDKDKDEWICSVLERFESKGIEQ